MSNGKDISEKILEDYDDVFMDILNGLVFNGREVIHEGELENVRTVSSLKVEGSLHEQERDTAKRWRRGTIVLAAWGLENQSTADPTMPLRIAAYDGAAYKEQVNRYRSARNQRRKPEPFYPSITIVLYFGLTHWTGPRSLRSCFHEMPKELDAFVPENPIHVIEVAFLTPEQIGRLKSDFRHVAGYLAYARTNGAYIPADGRIDHVDETLKLMEAITGDSRFRERMDGIAPEGKETVTMFNIIDSYMDRGREEARKEYEVALAERDLAMFNIIDSYLTKGREEARKEYEAALAKRDRAVKAALAEKDRTVKAALAEKDRTVQAALAERDRAMKELRELKLQYGLA